MVANAPEGSARDPRSQSQAAQCGHSGRHQSFAARLFSRKTTALEEFNGETSPPKLNRQGRTGDASTNNEDVGHIDSDAQRAARDGARRRTAPKIRQNKPGKKRGLSAIAARYAGLASRTGSSTASRWERIHKCPTAPRIAVIQAVWIRGI